MKPVFQTTDFPIIPRKMLWFGISLMIIIPGIIFFAMGGLKLGIDFTGGSLFDLMFEKPPEVSEVRQVLKTANSEKFSDAQVLRMQDNEGNTIISIRSKPIDNQEQVTAFEQLKQQLGTFEQLRVEVVGPTIGAELKSKALMAVLIVMGLIVIYISIRFSLDYAVCVIIALLHDVIAIVGIFAILGYFTGMEVGSLFVTAVLTVAGFSVNDTIVTFDRIRENYAQIARGKTFAEIANDSVNQTLTRSLSTSLTTLFPLLFVFIFGGETLQDFTLALLLGIVIGTYSSIFIASPLLVIWREMTGKDRRTAHRKKATAA